MTRPPVPPFDEESARRKAKSAEDAWNTRDPEKVAQAYTGDSEWRNRDKFFKVREEIVALLKRKWALARLPADEGGVVLVCSILQYLLKVGANALRLPFRPRPSGSAAQDGQISSG